MLAQHTGGYGSRPSWVFSDHTGSDAVPCAASGKTVAQASEG
jgi:hypothetical protein